MRIVPTLLAVLSLTGAAQAADVTVQILSADGKPVADAVVSIAPKSKQTAAPAKLAAPPAIAQRDMQFDPFVLIVPAGEAVSFPNFDGVQHHVYSFSPAKKFEIQLYGKGQARSVVFPVAGVVAIGCNIHDRMTAFVYVSDAPFTAKTGADGKATIANVPVGEATALIWHPHAAAPDQRIERPFAVTPTASLTAQLDLRTQRRPRHGNY